MSLSKLPEIVKDRKAWHAAVHEVAKSQRRLSDWTVTPSDQKDPEPINLGYVTKTERNHRIVHGESKGWIWVFFHAFQNWAAVSECPDPLARVSHKHEECGLLALPHQWNRQNPSKQRGFSKCRSARPPNLSQDAGPRHEEWPLYFPLSRMRSSRCMIKVIYSVNICYMPVLYEVLSKNWAIWKFHTSFRASVFIGRHSI